MAFSKQPRRGRKREGLKLSGDNKYPVKSLIKALSILEYIGASDTGGSLTEISETLKIGKSTVHRLLATLKDHDFVWLDPLSSRYILGARFMQLSGKLTRQSILIRYGEPILSKLAKATNETCNLGVLDGREVLYLIMKESKNPLRMSGQVGKRLPAHCTALGKALLSDLSQEELTRLYANKQKLDTLTPNSISTLAELAEHLQKVRQTGLAFDNEEIYPGVVCVAAPVRGDRGKVIAAVSVSFPKHRIDPAMLEDFKSLLSSCASELSQQLGSPTRGKAEDVA